MYPLASPLDSNETLGLIRRKHPPTLNIPQVNPFLASVVNPVYVPLLLLQVLDQSAHPLKAITIVQGQSLVPGHLVSSPSYCASGYQTRYGYQYRIGCCG